MRSARVAPRAAYRASAPTVPWWPQAGCASAPACPRQYAVSQVSTASAASPPAPRGGSHGTRADPHREDPPRLARAQQETRSALSPSLQLGAAAVISRSREALLLSCTQASASESERRTPVPDERQVHGSGLVSRLLRLGEAGVSASAARASEARPERARVERRHWLSLAEAKQARPRRAFRAVAGPARPAARDGNARKAGLMSAPAFAVQGLGSGSERGYPVSCPARWIRLWRGSGGVGCGVRQRCGDEALHGVEWLGALVCSAQDEGAFESCEEYGGIVLSG